MIEDYETIDWEKHYKETEQRLTQLEKRVQNINHLLAVHNLL